MDPNLQQNLSKLGKMTAANQADRALRKSCLGRVVSLLTWIFLLSCGCLYTGGAWLLYQSGWGNKFPGMTEKVLVVGFIVGFFACILVAGLIGNWLRRRIWKFLRKRR